MQKIILTILKYIALAASVYLIIRFLPNNCLSNTQILITTAIVIVIYIIFDSLFNLNLGNCANLDNLSNNETQKLCNTMCNIPKETMCNLNQYNGLFKPDNSQNDKNNDKNSISVNVTVDDESSQNSSQLIEKNRPQQGFDESGFIYNNYNNDYYDSHNYKYNNNLVNDDDYIDFRKNFKNKPKKQYRQEDINNTKWYPRLTTSYDSICPPCPPCPPCQTSN